MDTGRSRQLLFTGVAALGGLLLFAYAVRSVGLPIIVDGISRVGSGFAEYTFSGLSRGNLYLVSVRSTGRVFNQRVML